MRSWLNTVHSTDNATILYGPDAKILLACNNCQEFRAAAVVGKDVKVHTYTNHPNHDHPLRELLGMLGEEARKEYVHQDTLSPLLWEES